jgi:hypothetical protein
MLLRDGVFVALHVHPANQGPLSDIVGVLHAM